MSAQSAAVALICNDARNSPAAGFTECRIFSFYCFFFGTIPP
jgi:hypothetical protein